MQKLKDCTSGIESIPQNEVSMKIKLDMQTNMVRYVGQK